MPNLLNKRTKRQLYKLVAGLVFASIVLLAQQLGWLPKTSTSIPVDRQPGLYRVTKVIDGDTIQVDLQGQRETIRLIGVDTPETKDPRTELQCFGQAASDFTRNLIGMSDVRLEDDPTNNNRDRYNRLLRYVYLADGRLVNAEIISQGYGFAYTLYPFEKQADFTAYERQAREQNLGLWGSCQIEQDGDKKSTTPA